MHQKLDVSHEHSSFDLQAMLEKLKAGGAGGAGGPPGAGGAGGFDAAGSIS